MFGCLIFDICGHSCEQGNPHRDPEVNLHEVFDPAKAGMSWGSLNCRWFCCHAGCDRTIASRRNLQVTGPAVAGRLPLLLPPGSQTGFSSYLRPQARFMASDCRWFGSANKSGLPGFGHPMPHFEGVASGERSLTTNCRWGWKRAMTFFRQHFHLRQRRTHRWKETVPAVKIIFQHPRFKTLFGGTRGTGTQFSFREREARTLSHQRSSARPDRWTGRGFARSLNSQSRAT